MVTDVQIQSNIIVQHMRKFMVSETHSTLDIFSFPRNNQLLLIFSISKDEKNETKTDFIQKYLE